MRLTKYCSDCKAEKPWSDFYQSNPAYCKIHLNLKRKNYARNTQIPKGRGIYKLSKVIQWGIRRDYNEKKKMKDIAKFYKVRYANLQHWRKKGYLDIVQF